ncbi:hypothetical protein [Hymenobacter arizonensis]|uniref:Uncharacterized protein n=1 Tax=Hymenobacter arizonensis TaxID=1227077 RepID=A0A1I6B777_HYMAR|nr:hypothetical protein [Hymenobacter arizonensis]SFQ76792.1 hypothetical protein SAMN04515668_4251 [Hymenobacter arizonensis]
MKPLFLLKAARQHLPVVLLLLLLPLAGAQAQSGPVNAALAPLTDDGSPCRSATPVVHYYNMVQFEDFQDQLMNDDISATLCPDLNKRNPTDRRAERKLNRTQYPVTKNLVRA